MYICIAVFCIALFELSIFLQVLPVFVSLGITLRFAFSRNSWESSMILVGSIFGLNILALANVVPRHRPFHIFFLPFCTKETKERLCHCHLEFKCCSLCSSGLISLPVHVSEQISASGQEHISLRSMQARPHCSTVSLKIILISVAVDVLVEFQFYH